MTREPPPHNDGAMQHGSWTSADSLAELSSHQETELGTMFADLHEVRERLMAAQVSLEQCAREAQDVATRAKRDERRRLAQVLHDGLQQVLVAATMRIEMAVSLLPDGDAQSAAREAQHLMREAIRISRTMTLDLSPLHLIDDGLGPALIWLSDWFATHHGLKVTLNVATDAQPQSEAIRTLVFQGVREVLLNAVKHAGIDSAKVSMVRVGTELQITVEDRGVGFEPAFVEGKTHGFGLFSVKRRLELLGGAMDVVSAPGAGTRVTLKAPVVNCVANIASTT